MASPRMPSGLAGLTRPATERDTVGGVPARLVAAPATTEEAAALIAGTRDLAVVVRGGGTTLDWGVPPRRLDLIIDTHRLTGIVEHAAGDLVTVVRAGTRLDTLDLPGQQLALDVPLPGATVGGAVAADLSGPRRVLYGTVRDLLIGITVVRPDGRVAHAGGKVVKNVAGYDLGKLFTGSYGTLGLITECAFRLHPLPAAAAVVHVRTPGPADAGRLAAAVRAAQLVPSAVEVNAPPGDGGVEIAVLVEGSPEGVRERAAILRRLLGPGSAEGVPPWWGRLPWQPGDVGMKVGVPLSQVPALLAAARETDAPLTVRGSAGAGVLYAGFALSTHTHHGDEPPPAHRGDHPPDGHHGEQTPAGHRGDESPAGHHTDESPATHRRDQVSATHRGDQPAATRHGDQPPPHRDRSPRRRHGDGLPATDHGDQPPARHRDEPPEPDAYRCSEQRAGEVLGMVERLRATAVRAGGHAVVLTAPPEVRRIADMWGPVRGLALMRRVKDQFDPDHRFAPGRFVGGI